MADHDWRRIAFPTLEPAQMEALARCTEAQLRRFHAGEKLFDVGERDFNFFVVKAGEVEIRDELGDAPRRVVVHHAGQFTGDVGLVTGSPAVVSGVAQTDCEVYEISAAALHQVLNRCPNLSDIVLQAFIARRQLLHESAEFTGLRVIGSRYSQETFRIRDFLARNRVLFTWLDLEDDPQVAEVLKHFGLTEADTPVVACGRRLLMRNPSDRDLADAIGLRRPIAQVVYDLVVVGAGPAGLAAAVYGASEGLRTVVLEREGPGGQAGRSMRIENYLGFPTGLTGSELTDRAVIQANKFGAWLSIPTPGTALKFDNAYPIVVLDRGETVVARCLLIATGAEYRRLGVEGCQAFEGCGVYYAATPNEAQLCHGSDVVVVGGGNSAGQAAVFLAQQARKVFVLIRGHDLSKDMSTYLIRRIEQTSNIEVLPHTEVRRMEGDSHLREIEIANNTTGASRSLQVSAVFSFIGAVPRTDWLPPEIERDSKGFVRTGAALETSPHWTARRQPFLLETSRAGVFAAGDVRSESVKRVASAVGEGAMAVQFVHAYLKQM
jgi:thioredoxin reductase (NADPH)